MLCTAHPVETRKFFLLKVLFFGGVNLKNIKSQNSHMLGHLTTTAVDQFAHICQLIVSALSVPLRAGTCLLNGQKY
jgi:hypothetical protein